LGYSSAEVLKQARIELKMNLSLLEMLKGNTPLESLADLRDRWVEPLEVLIKELTKTDPSKGPKGTD